MQEEGFAKVQKKIQKIGVDAVLYTGVLCIQTEQKDKKTAEGASSLSIGFSIEKGESLKIFKQFCIHYTIHKREDYYERTVERV